MKRIGSIFVVTFISVLLIFGITNALASAEIPSENISAQTLSPSGGGGPGDVDNWFTYQGYLDDNGNPVNADCDFQFSLWDSSGSGIPPAGGIQIGTTENIYSLGVSDGLFSYPINASGSFSTDAFNGQRRYLQIATRCPAGGGTYTVLGPRQLLTASPYALSLRPGAVISASQSNPLLKVINSEDSTTTGGAIYAQGKSATAPAIHADHQGTGHALYGTSNSGYPTVGGLNSGSGNGVNGSSTSGVGVYAYTGSSNSFGVVGLQTGYSTSDLGGWFKPGGFFGGMNGVVGVTKANGGYGVLGEDQSLSGGWAGYFRSYNGGGVFITVPDGNVGINTNGTKNAVIATNEGARLMYSEESTEVWFSDYGFGQLQNGLATIIIDPLYAQTVNLSEPYHVFLQVYDNAEIYVTNRSTTGFEVHLRDGDANAEFSYRIVAQRLGYKDTRMEPAPWADNDPNLYPETENNPNQTQLDGQQP